MPQRSPTLKGRQRFERCPPPPHRPRVLVGGVPVASLDGRGLRPESSSRGALGAARSLVLSEWGVCPVFAGARRTCHHERGLDRTLRQIEPTATAGRLHVIPR